MTEDNLKGHDSIIDQYNDFYDDSIVEWRDLCARYKSRNIINISDGKKYTNVLDCGAGEGSVLKHLNDSDICENLYAIEISDSGIEKIKNLNLGKVKEIKKFDGYKIPFPDNYFDLVYCTHVIEHVEHPRILLREIKRVSKSQIFEVPLDYVINVDKYYKALHSFGHINIYTPSTFKYLLKSEGFTIKRDLRTNISTDVLRFDMYKNRKMKKTIFTELKLLIIWPILSLMKRVLSGPKRHNEFGFSAYTCSLEADDEIEIIF